MPEIDRFDCEVMFRGGRGRSMHTEYSVVSDRLAHVASRLLFPRLT